MIFKKEKSLSWSNGEIEMNLEEIVEEAWRNFKHEEKYRKFKKNGKEHGVCKFGNFENFGESQGIEMWVRKFVNS